ncbi:MAG: nucleotidyl transferase AbiEii/AbiGii toxin family protein [Acidobacteriia bacterium]|nr:nucleotidyl transferase AbiEii/AbiGii toxin family protein [Terriglobia bacterium]
MNRIARMDAAARAEIFAETAARKGLADAIVEKDFWVCWVLMQLFSIEALSGRLLFKGGTSLSKIFHAINRFSEDIDLAVDYAALGFTGARDPRQAEISKSRRNAILDEMMASCRQYVGGEFLSAFRTRCEEMLGPAGPWGLDVDPQDPNVVRFRYPAAATANLPYVTPQVVLELGTHAEFVPRDNFAVRSFVAEEFPKLVAEAEIGVVALLAKRTFWEKATILHAEFHRPEDKAIPGRYSRHYYDIAMLAQGPVRGEALADMDLLAQVVKHKQTFYPSAWAQYSRAVPGSLRLLPPGTRVAALKQDYRSMGVMIFGEPPAFDDILGQLENLEREINK